MRGPLEVSVPSYRRAHRADGRGVVLRPEDRASRDERVGARPRDRGNIVQLDPAVDLEPYLAAGGVDAATGFRQLTEHRLDEFLAAEARIDGHQEHEVYRVERVVEPAERRRRVQHETRPAAGIADQLYRSVDVPARLGMEADPGGTRRGEFRDQAVHGIDHQVDVDRRLHAVIAQRLADQRPNGEVRDVMVVHDVEMDPVGPGGEHGIDLRTKARKVRGQDRGRDDRLPHGTPLPVLYRMPRATRTRSQAAWMACVFCFATSSMDSGRPRATSLSG